MRIPPEEPVPAATDALIPFDGSVPRPEDARPSVPSHQSRIKNVPKRPRHPGRLGHVVPSTAQSSRKNDSVLRPVNTLSLDTVSAEALLGDPRIQGLIGQIYASLATGAPGALSARGTMPGRPFGMESLHEFERRFLDRVDEEVRVEGKAPSTARWHRDGLHSFCRFIRAHDLERPWIGGLWKEQARVIKEWLAWLRQQPTPSGLMSRRSIHGYFRGVRTIVASLAAADDAFNPFDGVPSPKKGEPERPRLLVTLVPSLLQTVDNYPWRSELEGARNSCLVRLYVLGGLRRDEALRLKNGDVNRDNGDIHVLGKGPDGGKHRLVCCPTAVQSFRRYFAAKTAARRTDDAFIISTTRAGGLGEVSVRRILSIVGKALGVHLAPHMLRRTAADLWREAGVPLPVIQRQLGHKHLSMTLYYSSVSDDALRRAMSKVDVNALGQ